MTPTGPKVIEVSGGISARVQLVCLRIAGLMTQWARFRGIQKLASALGRAFNPDNSIVLELRHGIRMRVYLNDGYWVKLAFRRFAYEPEVGLLLERLLPRSGAWFLDCGANNGYWSLHAARLLGGADRVVAVEASPAMFDRLVENATLNRMKPRCHLAAVWSQDGEPLVWVGDLATHPAGRVERLGAELRHEGSQLRSVSIDTLCDRYFPSPDLPVVIKLDVEGAEIPALTGARRLLSERLPLLIYEDHGSERRCEVSTYVLKELKLDVYYCSGRLPLRPMPSPATVRQVKTNPHRGYNFFACDPSSSFAPVLAELAQSRPDDDKGSATPLG